MQSQELISKVGGLPPEVRVADADIRRKPPMEGSIKVNTHGRHNSQFVVGFAARIGRCSAVAAIEKGIKRIMCFLLCQLTNYSLII